MRVAACLAQREKQKWKRLSEPHERNVAYLWPESSRSKCAWSSLPHDKPAKDTSVEANQANEAKVRSWILIELWSFLLVPPQLVHRQLPIAGGLLQPRPTQMGSIYHVGLFAFWKQSARIPTAQQLSMHSTLCKNSSTTNSRGGRTPPQAFTWTDGANVMTVPERSSPQRIEKENL